MSSILTCSIQAKVDSSEVYSVLMGCTSSKSMSQNGDPKMAISIGIYNIEGPNMGFMRGVAYIYIYVHMYEYVLVYIHP